MVAFGNNCLCRHLHYVTFKQWNWLEECFAEAQNWRYRQLIKWLIGFSSDLLIDFWLMKWPKKYPSHLGNSLSERMRVGWKRFKKLGLTKRFALKQIKMCRCTLEKDAWSIGSFWNCWHEPCSQNHFFADVNMWTVLTKHLCSNMNQRNVLTKLLLFRCERAKSVHKVTSIWIYQRTDCLEMMQLSTVQSILFLCSVVFIMAEKGHKYLF